MSTPYFPPPRPKPTGYRSPAQVEAPPVEPARIVVRRPELPPDSTRASKGPDARAIVDLARREQTYWERHRFFARHPRIIGGFLTVTGGVLTISYFDTLFHGGTYGVRGPMLAGLALCAGLWTLAAGYPLDDRGRVPRWYKLGLAASVFVGLAFGALLLVVMLGQSA